jgi:hypothetical protein
MLTPSPHVGEQQGQAAERGEAGEQAGDQGDADRELGDGDEDAERAGVRHHEPV